MALRDRDVQPTLASSCRFGRVPRSSSVCRLLIERASRARSSLCHAFWGARVAARRLACVERPFRRSLRAAGSFLASRASAPGSDPDPPAAPRVELRLSDRAILSRPPQPAATESAVVSATSPAHRPTRPAGLPASCSVTPQLVAALEAPAISQVANGQPESRRDEQPAPRTPRVHRVPSNAAPTPITPTPPRNRPPGRPSRSKLALN